jgi:hypothetical protein
MVNKLLIELKKPLETDKRENIIDLNWTVDWIMKNSQSYNKESGAIVADQILTGSSGRQQKQPVPSRTKADALLITSNLN